MKIKKYDLIILIISLFLQNFALIKTETFGIAFSTCFLIYLFFKYKIYKKISRKLIITLIILSTFLFLNSIINDNFNVSQILRLFMIIFDSWTMFQFVNILSLDEKKFFVKIFKYIFMICCVYGIYEYFAQMYRLPQFLNIFSNNPSYGARDLYAAYSGWSSTVRIYTCFFEPSAYSIFLVYSYFFIIQYSKKDKKSILLTILFLINLILTFARSGYMCAIYIVSIIIFVRIFKKNKFMLNIGRIGIIMIPMITFLMMLVFGTVFFDDYSIKLRTYSSLYYLESSVNDAKSIFIGNGIGSLNGADHNVIFQNIPIENYAHNGYIEIVYQFGYIFLMIIIYLLCNFIEKIPEEKKWITYGCVFTVCLSGAMYNVESIIILLSLICAFAVNYDNQKEVEKV